MNRYELGRAGEEYACRYLESLGFSITGRNVRVGHSEFDIICTDDKYIIFAEVKTRNESPDSPDRFGRPARAVTEKKSDALLRGAAQYIRTVGTGGRQPRIDVIEIYADTSSGFSVLKINHIKSAVVRTEKSENRYRGNR